MHYSTALSEFTAVLPYGTGSVHCSEAQVILHPNNGVKDRDFWSLKHLKLLLNWEMFFQYISNGIVCYNISC